MNRQINIHPSTHEVLGDPSWAAQDMLVVVKRLGIHLLLCYLIGAETNSVPKCQQSMNTVELQTDYKFEALLFPQTSPSTKDWNKR